MEQQRTAFRLLARNAPTPGPCTTSCSPDEPPGPCHAGRARVTAVRIGGILVSRTEELVFCEEAPDPNIGGGAQAKLRCPESVERGSEATCEATLDDEDVDASAIVFEWESGFKAAWRDTAGAGESRWSGVATDDTEVTVTVSGGGGFGDAVGGDCGPAPDVDVRRAERPGAGLCDLLGNEPQGVGRIRGPDLRLGSCSGGDRAVGGPVLRPPAAAAVGTMYLHTDFTTGGDAHSTAVGPACSAARARVTANVYEVNKACGLDGNLESWENMVTAHEQEHEDGANKCLRSGGAARDVLAEMEAMTGGRRAGSETRLRSRVHGLRKDRL